MGYKNGDLIQVEFFDKKYFEIIRWHKKRKVLVSQLLAWYQKYPNKYYGSINLSWFLKYPEFYKITKICKEQ